MKVLLAKVRRSLSEISGGDSALLFAYRRKLAKELQYDERGKPAQRRSLKRRKLAAQKGRCANCGSMLPPLGKGSVLDRAEAIIGYNESNTRLICRECDDNVQRERAFTG